MKPRYYLFRMGKTKELDDLTVDDLTLYQGYYCLDIGPDRNDARYAMILGGRLKDIDQQHFPSAFKAHLLIMDVP